MGRFWNHQTELTTFTMIVSLNQTWVHLPNCNKAHLLTAGCGEGKGNVYCRCQEESRQLALKRPELSHSFQGQIIKGRVRGVGCEVCDQLMDNLWLVGGEAFGSQHHQSSGSHWSGVYMLWVTYSQLLPPGGAFSTYKQLKGLGSEYDLQLLRRN